MQWHINGDQATEIAINNTAWNSSPRNGTRVVRGLSDRYASQLSLDQQA
jgi:hypothetical protein